MRSPHYDVFHKAAHDLAGPLLHIAGHMGVGIEGERRLSMAQDSRQGLGIHSVGQRVGGESVPEIMESKARQIVFRKDFFSVGDKQWWDS